MTFAELRTEVFARGSKYLDDSGAGLVRVKAWLNQAYQEVCEVDEWPFLRTASTPGPAPVTITDLRSVIFVQDSSNDVMLYPIDERTLRAQDADLASTGNPTSYWLDGLSTLRVHPINTTATIAVFYYRVPADLSADGDTPVVPARYHDLLVDLAVSKAAKDSQDWQGYQVLRTEADRAVQAMRRTLMDRHLDAPEFMDYAARDY